MEKKQSTRNLKLASNLGDRFPFRDNRLNIRNVRSGSLCKFDLGPEHQRAQQEIGQWADDVEVSVHVAMVQQVMSIQAEKESGPLDNTLFG